MAKTRLGMVITLLVCFFSYANKTMAVTPAPAPQPTACITGTFAIISTSSNQYWKSITLTLKNTCGQSVNLQNVNVTFNMPAALTQTNFWLTKYSPLAYPANSLNISQQNASGGIYNASFVLQFAPGSNSTLAKGGSLTINYGASTADFIAGSVKVYLNGSTPVQTGEIDLTNASGQPVNITQNYAVIDITSNGQIINSVHLPWSSNVAITGMAPGSYTIQPETMIDSQSNTYNGTAVPATVTVTANQKTAASINYSEVAQAGKVNITVSPLPQALVGYSNVPTVSVTQVNTGATTKIATTWNATTPVSQLVNNTSYSFSTPVINYNANNCNPVFTPATLTSSATSIPVTQLSYNCVPLQQDQVAINVSGLPSTTSSVNLSFTPADGSSPVIQVVSVANGAGTASVNLTDGLIYNVSASNVPGYAASFNPSALTVVNNATETVTWQRQSGGRIIGYLPGWNTPPAATDLSSAGYTHVIVAFGVFSTTQPGQVVPAFSSITKDYITSLHNAGIKVLLSLGGASTSISGTSVNFDQVIQLATSATAFRDTFVSSVENLMTTYGFDGVDIDIEQGLNVGGTFTQPSGDLGLLAAIINKLHSDNPSLLISLAPQVANIAATSGFDSTWGNYASLIMQTYKALSWIGIQLYNTGCAYGLNQICYGSYPVTSPDISVAMADDLLNSWPSSIGSGINLRQTGFQAYMSYLNPDQIVLGYPAVNNAGVSDGQPPTPVATIKRAIQCLRTAVAGTNSCDTYVPVSAYPEIGGVFDWEITHDQSNNYQFAKSLSACVLSGNCN